MIWAPHWAPVFGETKFRTFFQFLKHIWNSWLKPFCLESPTSGLPQGQFLATAFTLLYWSYLFTCLILFFLTELLNNIIWQLWKSNSPQDLCCYLPIYWFFWVNSVFFIMCEHQSLCLVSLEGCLWLDRNFLKFLEPTNLTAFSDGLCPCIRGSPSVLRQIGCNSV